MDEAPPMTPQERLEDSLKHVFVDSCHILCECIISSQGFWCKSAFNPAHPMGWLINKFPVKNDSSLAWFPLHWCALSNSSDIIDINTLYNHYGAAPKLRLQLHQHVSALTMAVSKPQPNVEIVQMLAEVDPMVVQAKSTRDGSLPIMHALANNDNDESIRLLYRLFPESLKESDAKGNKAIHIMLANGAVTMQ